MSINSVQTNAGAMIALQSLNKTTTDMAAAQKQVSTGYRVADATDDGAAFAVAQSVRSTVSSLTTANQQLGNVQGLITTTQTGLTSVSNTMASMREVLVSLGYGNLSTTQRAQYTSQYNSLLSAVKNNIADSGYNGTTLIGSGATRVVTIRNEAGATYGLSTFGGAAVATSLALATGTAATATAMRTALTSFDIEPGRLRGELRQQPDHLQPKQDRLAEHWSRFIGGRRSGQGIREFAGTADPPAVGHTGPVDGKPGAADAAEPVQVRGLT
jgi:flagellin